MKRTSVLSLDLYSCLISLSVIEIASHRRYIIILVPRFLYFRAINPHFTLPSFRETYHHTPVMDSTQYITTMPTMDIFAYEKVPGTEKSMLRRQQAIPERRFSISFEGSDSDFDANMDLDPEDDYFSQTYAPLSCLPTPPMRCAATSPFTQALESAFVQDKDTNLLGKRPWCLNGISCHFVSPD